MFRIVYENIFGYIAPRILYEWFISMLTSCLFMVHISNGLPDFPIRLLLHQLHLTIFISFTEHFTDEKPIVEIVRFLYEPLKHITMTWSRRMLMVQCTNARKSLNVKVSKIRAFYGT